MAHAATLRHRARRLSLGKVAGEEIGRSRGEGLGDPAHTQGTGATARATRRPLLTSRSIAGVGNVHRIPPHLVRRRARRIRSAAGIANRLVPPPGPPTTTIRARESGDSEPKPPADPGSRSLRHSTPRGSCSTRGGSDPWPPVSSGIEPRPRTSCRTPGSPPYVVRRRAGDPCDPGSAG